MSDPKPPKTTRKPILRVAFNLDASTHPHLYRQLSDILAEGSKGAVGQRLAYLASLGLTYEQQSLGNMPEIGAQVVVSKAKARVRVPQNEKPEYDAGAPKSDLSRILSSPEPNPAQVVDSTGQSSVQVPESADAGEEAARKLASTLVRRGAGFGRNG